MFLLFAIIGNCIAGNYKNVFVATPENNLIKNGYVYKQNESVINNILDKETEMPSVVFTLSCDVTNASCFGEDGTIVFNPSGGAAPYTYIVNGNTATSPYTAAAGTYTVVSTDNVGAIASTVVTLTQPNEISLTANATPAACFLGNGQLDFSAIGGTGVVTFTTQAHFATITSPYSTAAGTYSLVAKDENNCSASALLIVAEPPPSSISTTLTNPLCATDSGLATFSISGNFTPLSYSLNSELLTY